MKDPETHYVRLTLDTFNSYFRTEDTQFETDSRLWDVLTESFLMEPLTMAVAQANKSLFEPWLNYRADPTMLNRVEVKKINAVGKFEIDKAGAVRLLDIAFA